jgi:YD repeat-containing protein
LREGRRRGEALEAATYESDAHCQRTGRNWNQWILLRMSQNMVQRHTYAYHLVGALGAGQIASVDGPLTDDVITYTHDQLGRLATRTINGGGITQTYDSLGRVTTQLNSLGTFTCGYDGPTSRTASVVYPNLQTTTCTYFGNLNDHRLQTIHHQRPGGVTLSKFDYTYDAAGNILTWQQQADSASPVVWAYAYDQADQLLAAVQSSTTTTPAVLKRYGYALMRPVIAQPNKTTTPSWNRPTTR